MPSPSFSETGGVVWVLQSVDHIAAHGDTLEVRVVKDSVMLREGGEEVLFDYLGLCKSDSELA